MNTQRYSKQDAIDALQSVAEKLNKSPTISEYKRNKKDHHPSHAWIHNKFGSWNNAKELAGLDILNTAGSVEYNKKSAINALQYVAEKIDRSLSRSEYRANKKDHHPGPDWIQDNLGSWNNAKDSAGLKKCQNYDGGYKDKKSFMQKIKRNVQCRECGLEGPNKKLHFHHVESDTKVDKIASMVNSDYSMEELKTEIKKCEILCDTCHGHKHSKKITKQDCIDALKFVSNNVDGSVTCKEYQLHKKDTHPSFVCVSNKFESWNDAKREVGLDVNNIRHSKQDSINAVQFVADKLGKSPTKKEYQKHKKDKQPSIEWMADNLSSWNDLKTEAGLDVYRRRQTKQDCIDAIQYVSDKIEEIPSCTQYQTNKKDSHPSMDTLYRRFGNWSNAIEAAGLQ